MTYWTWSDHDGKDPTLHVFSYGLWNIWDDGLTTNEWWGDCDPPNLKPEVLEDIKLWGGEWNPSGLEVRFHNDDGPLLWKMKYKSKSGCTERDPSDIINESSTDTNSIE